MKTKFKIKGYINDHGDPRFKVYKKSFLYWSKLYFNVLYDDTLFEEELVFISAEDAEEFINTWYSTPYHNRAEKVVEKEIAGRYIIKYTPKTNKTYLYLGMFQVRNKELIYDNINDCLTMDSYLRKTWIEKYFEI